MYFQKFKLYLLKLNNVYIFNEKFIWLNFYLECLKVKSQQNIVIIYSMNNTIGTLLPVPEKEEKC